MHHNTAETVVAVVKVATFGRFCTSRGLCNFLQQRPLLASPFISPSLVPAGKVFVPKQRPIEARQEDVTTLDPELEEALSSATDRELCDLAGETENQTKRLWPTPFSDSPVVLTVAVLPQPSWA